MVSGSRFSFAGAAAPGDRRSPPLVSLTPVASTGAVAPAFSSSPKRFSSWVITSPVCASITCSGSFRLRGNVEYAPILQLMTQAADAKPETLTLDVRELRFLNSSGINTLSKFVIYVRKNQTCQMIILGSSQSPWQRKSLKNFQRLLPGLQLEIE